jgi:predicted nucleic acid-binding protein
MAEYLLDTSALVKYYHPEVGSSRVIALVDDPGNVSYLSRLTLIEIHSVFARLVREGHLDERGLRG